MTKLPKDVPSRVIGARARQLVHSSFNPEHWEYHEYTGCDRGIDCVVELIEAQSWTNKKIAGQIKGTRSPHKLKTEDAFSFPLEIKTINYGLSSSVAFVLFLVDTETETVYYLPLQDYFISDPSLFDCLKGEQDSLNLHVPCNNIVSADDHDLCQIAKSVYVDGPTSKLRKVK